jgi:hypothetical protein
MLTNGDVYEVSLRATNLTQAHYNVLHIRLLDDQTESNFLTNLQAFCNAWKEVWRGGQNANFAWQSYRAVQVAGAGITYDTTTCRRSGGDLYDGIFTGTLVGGISSADSLASFNALAILLKTGLAGRSRQGHAYIGGNSENDVNGNTWASAMVAARQADLDAFVGVYGNLGTDTHLEWVVFSRFIASGCKYVPALPKPVLTHVQAGDQAGASRIIRTATISPLVTPMHRRKSGIGI